MPTRNVINVVGAGVPAYWLHRIGNIESCTANLRSNVGWAVGHEEGVTMARVLAIETAIERGSVALLEQDED